MVGKIVRVTSPSRSNPRKVSVSIRCEMPPILRFSSLKRIGPSISIMITNTLHLSPTRASTEATARQLPSACGPGGMAGTFLCSGLMDVLLYEKCAFLRGFATVTHIAPVTNLYQRVTSTMKLLHIDSSVLGPHSVSRQVSAAIVERLRQSTPGLEISYRDLTLTPLGHLSGSHLAAGQGATADASLREDIAAGQAVLEEVRAAEIVLLG